MTEAEIIKLEEILLGYLRSSKKIKLANIVESQDDIDGAKSTYTVSFIVDNDFGKTLMNAMDNPFSELLKDIK